MNIKKSMALFSAVIMGTAFLSGCGDKKEITIPESKPSTLKPVGNFDTGNSYEGVEPVIEETIETFKSADGLCVIEKKPSYYDVTLDYSKGDYYKVGSAYAEAIMLAYPDYGKVLEPYLYENIRMAFPEMKENFSGMKDRVDAIFKSIDKNYQQELKGFAEKISSDDNDFESNGKISKYEAYLFQIIPDVVRPCSCSTISVSGKKTASGKRLTSRQLEWGLGSSNQICTAHSVTHVKNGDKSYTAVSVLGMFSILTAINDDGVMVAIHDVGSYNYDDFEYEGKTSYTYSLRNAIENFSTAKETGEYLIANSMNYTYTVNLLVSDAKDAYCAEIVTSEDSIEIPVLRDSSTPVHDGLEWDDPECFCIVNSHAAKCNYDMISHDYSNLVRWDMFNEKFCHEDNITTERFKELLTSQKVDTNFVNIRNGGLVHMVIADYADKSIQVVFTGTDGIADTPDFIKVGTFD